MKPQITFFPVGNGDMTLVKVESGQRILIDVNIRVPGDDIPDVATELRNELQEDSDGRPYVDVMVLSHPDQDHCRGFEEHFHVGPLADYDDDADTKKIVVREMWSSPLVFRRSQKNHTLCADAKVWNKEARRRANLYRDTKKSAEIGDRILILGEDQDGKTDDIPDIVLKVGTSATGMCGQQLKNFSALLLAPLASGDVDEEAAISKNESSVIMNYSIGAGTEPAATKFLSGGDAEVAIWEKLWCRHKKEVQKLEYNLLSTPHHCSWHSLSWDSWSGLGRKAKVSPDARSALGQALPGAIIVASAKEIKDDENDPPCHRAKEEYEAILSDAKVSGNFWNTGAYLSADEQKSIIFEVSEGGLKMVKAKSANTSGTGGSGSGMAAVTTPLVHG